MTLSAPPERVFDVLAAHADYGRFRPMRRAALLHEGDPAPNGVGALRRIWATPLVFDEEITAYQRPKRLDYVIRRLTVAGRVDFPFEHEGGSIKIAAADGGTAVDWTTIYRVPVPVVGGAITAAFTPSLRRAFRQVLEDTERIAAAG